MTGKAAPAALGFGFRPDRSAHHFFVVPPDGEGGGTARVFERFAWDDSAASRGVRPADSSPEGQGRLRLELPPVKWNWVAPPLVRALNRRLRDEGLPSGRFRTGGTLVGEDLGKEMLVLLWAVALADPGQIVGMADNWSLFRPEELRWLYTMTDAAWGGPDDRRGWRAALREMLAVRPPPIRDFAFDAFDSRPSPKDEEADAPPAVAGPPPPHRKSTFGFRPEDGLGFFVTIPRPKAREPVLVREGAESDVVARLPLALWKLAEAEIAAEFNLRLREAGRAAGSFAAGTTAVGRLFGKEMLVLLWALEPCAKSCAPAALRNWKALAPAERRWLYTMASANPEAWKRALAWALCETPVLHQEPENAPLL